MKNRESSNIGVDEIYLTVENFIKDRISGVENIINTTDKNISPYDKFLLLPQLIEFLGACLDDHDFEKKEESSVRFKRVISNYIGNSIKYKTHIGINSKFDLYQDFRCGLIHQLRPLNDICLTTEKEAEEDGNEHMVINPEGQLIMTVEKTFSDIKKASENVLKEIQNKLSKNCSEEYRNKLTKTYLTLYKFP